MSKLKSKFYYGYIVVLLSFISLFASMGIRGSFGTYVSPWEIDFDVSRVQVSTVSFISLLVYGISMVFAGRLADRYGPRRVLSISMFIMGLCLMVSFFVTNIFQMMILYGLVASIGFGFASNVTVSIAIVKWFKEKKGLMISIVVIGMAAGPMIFTALNIYLIDAIGWRWMFMIYGAIYTFMFVPLYALFFKNEPEAEIDQKAELSSQSLNSEPTKTAAKPVSPWSIFRHPITWLIIIPYFICGFTDIGFIQTHFIPLGEDRVFTKATIANVMVVYGIANIIGTLAIGYITDIFSHKKIIGFLHCLRIVGLLLLCFFNDPVWLFVFAVFYGMTDIATIAPFTMLCSKIYGIGQMGLAFGFISFFHQFGGATGSLIPGYLFSFSSNYTSSLWFCIGLLVISAIIMFSLNDKKKVFA